MAEYVEGAAGEPPVFQPANTPVYSNVGYTLAGVALSRITGKSLEDIFDQSLVKALSLKGTSYGAPPSLTGNYVIPAPNKTYISATSWSNEFEAISA